MSEWPRNVRFPNESEEYRRARNELLEAELELRERIEKVATLRRGMPLGHRVDQDYVFQGLEGGAATQVPMSSLFEAGKDSLVLYSFMYGPDMGRPCPMCTSLLDGLNGSAPHFLERINFAVVARSPIQRIVDWGRERGWGNLRLLSSAGNDYNADYFAETSDGSQLPACNVFVRQGGAIHHFYATEVLYAPIDGHPRHMDLMWPVWNLLDLTPEGRGIDWMPKLAYDAQPA